MFMVCIYELLKSVPEHKTTLIVKKQSYKNSYLSFMAEPGKLAESTPQKLNISDYL